MRREGTAEGEVDACASQVFDFEAPRLPQVRILRDQLTTLSIRCRLEES